MAENARRGGALFGVVVLGVLIVILMRQVIVGDVAGLIAQLWVSVMGAVLKLWGSLFGF